MLVIGTERITKESKRIRAKLAFRKQRNESQIIDSTIKTKIRLSVITVKEVTEERAEQQDKTRD